MRRGQNKHGLKKIKHALLSSQETITLPVQAPEPAWFRLLFRGRLFFCFPAAFAAVPLCCVFTLSGVPRPAKSAVCVNQIGVKPVLLFPVQRFLRGVFTALFPLGCSKQLPEPTRSERVLGPSRLEEDVRDRGPVPSRPSRAAHRPAATSTTIGRTDTDVKSGPGSGAMSAIRASVAPVRAASQGPDVRGPHTRIASYTSAVVRHRPFCPEEAEAKPRTGEEPRSRSATAPAAEEATCLRTRKPTGNRRRADPLGPALRLFCQHTVLSAHCSVSTLFRQHTSVSGRAPSV